MHLPIFRLQLAILYNLNFVDPVFPGIQHPELLFFIDNTRPTIVMIIKSELS